MQVRAGGVAVVAHLGNDLTSADALTHLDEDTVRVHVHVPAVEGRVPHRVFEDDQLAGAPQPAGAGVHDGSIGHGVDRGAERGGEVHTGMHGVATEDRVDAIPVGRADAVAPRRHRIAQTHRIIGRVRRADRIRLLEGVGAGQLGQGDRHRDRAEPHLRLIDRSDLVALQKDGLAEVVHDRFGLRRRGLGHHRGPGQERRGAQERQSTAHRAHHGRLGRLVIAGPSRTKPPWLRHSCTPL